MISITCYLIKKTFPWFRENALNARNVGDVQLVSDSLWYLLTEIRVAS